MAAMTLAEAQSQLATVDAAIDEMVRGKRRVRLEVGSGDFRRVYQNQEITLETLQALRAELLQIINGLTEVTSTFRANCSIPLIVTKGPY